MTPFDAFRKYLAIKSHFQQKSYDYFKCHGKTRASFQSFEKRRDKVFFHRLVKLYNEEQLEQLFLANFLHNQNCWIGDITSPGGRDIYLDWKKRYQSMQYTFMQDMLVLHETIEALGIQSFDFLFIKRSGEVWAPIVDLAIKKRIGLETFVILDKILNCISALNYQVDDSVLWEPYRDLALKYSPFLVISGVTYKNILRENFLKKQLDDKVKIC